VIATLTVVIPILIVAVSKLYNLFKTLPQNVLLFLYGFVFCFFGGLYPTLFAAVTAAEHGGRAKVVEAVSDLADEAMAIIEESKKDDDKDDDGDGRKDVDQLSGQQLLARKTQLVLKKMNPEKVDKAISSLYTVWLAVAAVLAVKFARTISLSLTIAQALNKPCERFIAPTLNLAIPNDYRKWTPIVLSWIVKSFAMSIAWYIQSVVSAFASALDGGIMMSRALYQFCVAHKLTLFGLIPEDHTQSSVDEFFGYIFSAAGFYFQFQANFTTPFPLTLILWPFNLAEYYIRWTITK
jgi:hypothetical protein